MPKILQEPKVLIIRSKGQNNQTGMAYADFSTGMVIGSAAGDDDGAETTFGPDRPTAELRYFISLACADAYIKGKIRELAGREDIDFLIRDSDPLVRVASNINHRRM